MKTTELFINNCKKNDLKNTQIQKTVKLCTCRGCKDPEKYG